MKILSSFIFAAVCILAVHALFAAENGCDKVCLERLAEEYRAAYLQHDPGKALIAKNDGIIIIGVVKVRCITGICIHNWLTLSPDHIAIL